MLEDFIRQDEREDMRATAVWAIGAILGFEAETIYQQIESTETSELVHEEIRLFREEWDREDRVI